MATKNNSLTRYDQQIVAAISNYYKNWTESSGEDKESVAFRMAVAYIAYSILSDDVLCNPEYGRHDRTNMSYESKKALVETFVSHGAVKKGDLNCTWHLNDDFVVSLSFSNLYAYITINKPEVSHTSYLAKLAPSFYYRATNFDMLIDKLISLASDMNAFRDKYDVIRTEVLKGQKKQKMGFATMKAIVDDKAAEHGLLYKLKPAKTSAVVAFKVSDDQQLELTMYYSSFMNEIDDVIELAVNARKVISKSKRRFRFVSVDYGEWSGSERSDDESTD
ncbi:MAG: hypothetical protein II951_09600 [Bacteroidales bacterium]|nr:hypothetical protein [Bacteroidales bacterium]